MKLLADLHIHTIASGHAYSSVTEIVDRANKLNLEAIAITDHGPGLPDGPHIYHFENQRRFFNIPGKCVVLTGVEEDLAGPNGEVFLPDRILSFLEIVLVGFHPYPNCWVNNNSKSSVVKSLLTAMENPNIKGITHPVNDWFDLSSNEIKSIVKNARPTSTAVELNLSKIKGLENKLFEFLDFVAEYDAPLMINSDAHILHEVGDFSALDKFAHKIIPENVVNLNYNTVKKFFGINRR